KLGKHHGSIPDGSSQMIGIRILRKLVVVVDSRLSTSQNDGIHMPIISSKCVVESTVL
ncbi:hypothetical protein Dimus_020234, partial [Dionaea muscipula]